MIGYKLLTADMQSLTQKYSKITYGPEWKAIPGNGAYIGVNLLGLLAGGAGEILTELEYQCPTVCEELPKGVVTASQVRILRTVPVDNWTWIRLSIYAARLVVHLSNNPRALQAIKAAERYENERSEESAKAVIIAAEALQNTWGSQELMATQDIIIEATWAARNAAWTAWSEWLADVSSSANVVWATWTTVQAATRIGGTRMHEQIMDQVRALFDKEK